MAAGGENRWPYLGRNRWPLTASSLPLSWLALAVISPHVERESGACGGESQVRPVSELRPCLAPAR
jgi:hypothetical protein